ncbi:MAG: class I SAM-dependent methyltransferase [Gemmatimonadales bacterium]|nr:MAG: class I SAM-dependent methyltransferase [Gemmatimonadales bacterium]
MKRYDRTYFDRWYRGEEPPKGEAELRRQVALAVAATESVLDRPLKSVLDVGCGEGRWQPILHEIRPEASYLGIDPSGYAVERFGASRNLLHGSLDDLESFAFEEPFDLVVCADVMHYMGKEAVLRAMDIVADLVGGVALLEVFTSEDPVEGDREDFHLREPAWYWRVFAGAGLVPIGLQMYVHREIAESMDSMDLPTRTEPGHA